MDVKLGGEGKERATKPRRRIGKIGGNLVPLFFGPIGEAVTMLPVYLDAGDRDEKDAVVEGGARSGHECWSYRITKRPFWARVTAVYSQRLRKSGSPKPLPRTKTKGDSEPWALWQVTA